MESGLAAHRQTPALLTGAGSQPLGSALVSGQGGRGGGLAPRPAPPLHREGTPPGQRRPPVPRPEPAEGRGPAAAADGRAGRRPRGNTAGRREEREAAGPGPRGQPGPARQPPLRAHLTLSDNPRPDLPPGRLTQPRPVPTERRQPRSRPPLPAPGRPRLSSPLFSSPFSSRHHTGRGAEAAVPAPKLRAPATSPGSRACVPGPGPAVRSRGGGHWFPASFLPCRGSAAPKAAGSFRGAIACPSPL